jgi:hypothetical protein
MGQEESEWHVECWMENQQKLFWKESRLIVWSVVANKMVLGQKAPRAQRQNQAHHQDDESPPRQSRERS